MHHWSDGHSGAIILHSYHSYVMQLDRLSPIPRNDAYWIGA